MTETILLGERGSPKRRTYFLLTLLASTMVLAAASILLPLSGRATREPLELGDVATQDILSPQSMSYESQVLTERQRQTAADAVAPVYAPPNAAIARAQVNQLRTVLTYINTVRADAYATPQQKAADLTAIQNIVLPPESITQLLGMNDTSWGLVQQEAITVLEQVMRSTIREDRLEEARRSVPALVSFSLPEEQAMLVANLVTPLVTPNSLYSESLTEAQRLAARDAVQPVVQSYATNQMVVVRGRVITAADMEALEQLGLTQDQTTWQDQVSVIALVLVSFGYIVFYLQYRPDILSDLRGLLIIAILFILFLTGARLMVPNRTVIPYIYPMAAYGLVISALISSPAGRILALPLGLLAGYGLPNSFELSLYYVLTSMLGVLVLRKAERISSFFWAGAGISAAGAMVILAFRLVDQTTDWLGLVTLIGATLAYGLASVSLAVLLQFFLAQALGLTTTLQLMEISRPDNELLKQILRKAPGTYQHSLQVANLAEQAAELIEADAFLVRVGSLFHDAGKMINPGYFIENQIPGAPNPHDKLTPLESSQVIVKHVTDGVVLAQQHKLPKRIQDFILEHHGTMLTRYQYGAALEAAGGDRELVDKEAFRYPGPKPQSVETALVLLADGVEARARAERPDDEEAIRALVEDTVGRRRDLGELDDTSLRMKDIKVITESFITTLKGVYHPRIQYPTIDLDSRPRDEVLDEMG